MQWATFFQGWRQNEVILVLLIGLMSIILWRVPFIGWVFYPFQLFSTFVHEISHGLAAILTGGEFRRFAVSPDLSGLAWSAGGWRWVVTSAGYVGCAIFGGILTVLSARGLAANHVLFFLGVILGILCLIFVRNVFGIVSGLVLAGLLIFAGQRLNVLWADALLLFLAVQIMLNSMNSLLDLFWLSTNRANVLTDAQIMQDLTGLPAPLWAVVWSVISFVILGVSLTLAYRDTPAVLQP